MKKAFISVAVQWIFFSLAAQPNSFRFDFGEGKTAPGHIKITTQSKFSAETGYGFEGLTALKPVNRSGKNPLTSDYITSSTPFFFSVNLPEGNYDVQVTLGDLRGTSATTIRAECRRLMVENFRTAAGKTAKVSFTVHIRDSLIRDATGKIISKVRLKPREKSYRHWDNKLTIEFNDSLPKICGIQISPAKKPVTIFLAGNSTVVDQDREPWAAWGQMFPRFLTPNNVVVANYAESGETMKAFKGERRLEKIWLMAKPGDYLFIEFTHNDQKPGGNHLDPFTTYKQTIKDWIGEARKRQINIVLVTSMHRRSFDSAGRINNTLLDYPEAMRQTAREEDVMLIDLNSMSKVLYEEMGPEQSIKAFVHYPANSFPNQPEPIKDNTHFSPYGAYLLAQCVVESIRQQNLPLAKFIQKDIFPFDSARPITFENFYWPPSVLMEAAKPDGN